eukprot:974088-Rhodomonas_salina.4
MKQKKTTVQEGGDTHWQMKLTYTCTRRTPWCKIQLTNVGMVSGKNGCGLGCTVLESDAGMRFQQRSTHQW